jgi:predicted ATPase/DNA-binding SARP family transcriptional activator
MNASLSPELFLYFFGAPRLERKGLPVTPDTRKAVALLAYLVITGQPHTRDALAAMFYPDNDETHAKAALRRTLSALNKSLGEGFILATHKDIAMQAKAPIWVDVVEFSYLLDEAKSCRHNIQADSPLGTREFCPTCLALLEQAAGLYRGDFMAGFSLRDSLAFDEWQFFKSEELRRAFAFVLKKLTRGASLSAEHEKAIRYARQWVALDPLLEDAHRELMSCYALAGQRNAALRQYQECARILETELGVEPLQETQHLYHEIKQNRLPALKVAEPTLMPGSSHSNSSNLNKLAWIKFPLVGRSVETEYLLRTYQQYAQRGYFFALQGEAGIGKTRLAEEFVAWARQQRATVLSARCFEGETSLAYAPFIELLSTALEEPGARAQLDALRDDWLIEAARLLPTLRAKTADPRGINPIPNAQSLFYEGLRQVLLRLAFNQPPGVLFLDDLHWADPASLDFLAYLVRRLPGNSLFILTAWRDENLPAQARLRQVLAEAQRAQFATDLRLSRLQSSAVADLARQISAQKCDLPADFTDRLFQESEGLPYFLVEYLDAFLLTNSNAFQVETFLNYANREWELPDRVRDILRLRIAQIDDLARQLLTAAAVIGRSFDFETLIAASGRSEVETLTGLETLLAHRLVEECGSCEPDESIIYDFTHDKLRSFVNEETNLTRRRLLHRRIADALAERARRSRDPGLIASSIAQHYQLAGLETQAAEYHRLAGEYAQRLYANQQALDHYYAALEAGHTDLCGLYEAIGDLHTLLGGYQSALDAYAHAAPASVGAKDNARLLQKIGAVHNRRGEYIEAVKQYQQALTLIDASSSIDSFSAALGARILADWSLAAYQQGEMEGALALAERALERANKANAPRALAQAHNLLGVLARNHGQIAIAQQHLEESLSLAIRLQDESAQVATLNNLALLMKEVDQIDQSACYAHKALILCERQGDRHRAAALHNNLADIYHLSGQPEKAIEHLKQAVTIFTEIGGGAGDMQSEVWKLTEW